MSDHHDPIERLRLKERIVAKCDPDEIAQRCADLILELSRLSEVMADINVVAMDLEDRRMPSKIRDQVDKIAMWSLGGWADANGMLEIGLDPITVIDERNLDDSRANVEKDRRGRGDDVRA